MNSPKLFPVQTLLPLALRCQASALLQLCSAYCARGELKRGLGDNGGDVSGSALDGFVMENPTNMDDL